MPSDNDQSEVLAKLDTIIAIMQLAFKTNIDSARSEIMADPVSASILANTAGGWVEAGVLRTQVAEETKKSARTIQMRVASLLSQRVLEQSGAGPKTRYRSTGLL